jgi:chromosome segregation ATPase
MSKALKLQQEAEDRKNEFIISELENKVEDLEGALKEKDDMVQSLWVDLTEAQKSNKDIELEKKLKDENIVEQDKHIQQLINEMEKTKTSHSDNVSRLDLEIENLKQEVKTKREENSKLIEALKIFVIRSLALSPGAPRVCARSSILSGRLRKKASYAPDDLPIALGWVEGEVDAFDEVMKG